MKRKWIGVLAAAAVLCQLFAGCEQKEKNTAATETQTASVAESTVSDETEPETENETVEFELALVTDGRTLEKSCMNQTAWEGLRTFAEEYGLSHRYYRPAGTEPEDEIAAIEEAVSAGAGMIVCVGEDAEAAILQMQEEHPQVEFVLVDGEPREEDGAVLKENVQAVRFQVEQGAYIAGYACGVSGFVKIGYIGMEEDENSRRYCYGLLQGLNDGAEKAAGYPAEHEPLAELHTIYLKEDDVTGETVGALLKEWRDEGITMMMSGTEKLSSVCVQRSQGLDLFLILSEVGNSEWYSNVMAVVELDASSCVYNACRQYYSNAFRGGGIVFYDASTDSVRLNMKNAHFSGFTAENGRTMQEQLASGEIQINNDITVEMKELDMPFVQIVEEKP